MVKLPNKAKLFCALLVVLKRRQSLVFYLFLFVLRNV